MHHFIYPAKDTYITNRTQMDDRNFGITEVLHVGTSNTLTRTLSATKDFSYVDAIFDHQGVDYFVGEFTGSFSGTVDFANGTISGSGITFSASYFSGSVDGTGSIGSGSFGNPLSGSTIIGTITGSVIATDTIGLFTGVLTGSIGCLTGTGSGVDTRNEQSWVVSSTKFVDRSLLQFDVTAISASIVDGAIAAPQFFLRLRVCNEVELPITYTVYALPVSQSWNMGNGFFSDGGSANGATWRHRDNAEGIAWYTQSLTTPRPAIDFISHPNLVTASFAYGGGTFYTSNWCSQSFNYESSDINMDITPMVMSWISGSVPNQGLVLLHSDELQNTGSGFSLTFFSEDTNTIYSPYLDAMWDDVSGTFSTGSFSTSSVTISTASAGISASVQSGSTFNIAGGVSGSFSSSVFMVRMPNYITASNALFNTNGGSDAFTINTWYVNNGYHLNSWFTAWDLDPNHGGFLPNTGIVEAIPPTVGNQATIAFTGSFTGSFFGTASYVNGTISGSGLFTASFFTGSVDGVNTSVTSGSVSGSGIMGNLTGMVTTPTPLGLFTGQLTSSVIFLTGTGSGYYLDTTYAAFSGFTDGKGLGGNIIGIPIWGNVVGIVSTSQSLVTGPCGSSFSASFAKASFTSGPFSSSTFAAYYIDNKFENALLTGSWLPEDIYGARVSLVLPSEIAPYAYAYVVGEFISGKALGLYVLSGSTSASFNGQFVDGNLLGGYLSLQLSGSVYSSSFSFTSSVEISSSFLNTLDTARPFAVTVYNLKMTYKAGDIAKVNVFGRKEFPLKTFGKSTQQEQYLVPEVLPTSSYYALKDNETGEIIMNFDSYTRIGCEYPEGNYFLIDTTSLPPERYYRVLIRVDDSQSVYTFDTGKSFKITR